MENEDDKEKMHEHMEMVSNAIHKINEEQELNDTDIREVLRSLMNAQMMVSEAEKKLGDRLDADVKQLANNIKRLEDHLFRDETKFNYRVRYALSQKGRMAVQRFYNSL